MTKLSYRTKNNSSPENKPKVYFSCHPDDFEKTFDAVCGDIFQTHDCAIFYKEDMADSLPEETREVDLGCMNLFVFPVTFRMLQGGNLAVGEDLVFAKRNFKPILPILFEANAEAILPFYTKPEMFGERQFLNKFSHDQTEISFGEKLKKYLDSTLIDDDTVEKIRKAFDAQIFLSYRKKDRKYANELMQLIHKDPLCRNIAIWFDEFLTPGESFNTSIEKALTDSQLVTLLVTPSLLETPNYIQQVEYPSAIQSGKPILPAEKLPTDREGLKRNYQRLPDVINTSDEDRFHQAFINALEDMIPHGSEYDSMHDYLIGLAYLDGIEVEVNKDYGVELITKAAEAELPEAMKKLHDMYKNGQYVSLNYQNALYWAEKLYQYYANKKGKDHLDTLVQLNTLATAFNDSGNYEKALELHEQCYEVRCKVSGEKSPDTLSSLNNLAISYANRGNYKKAIELSQKCYELECEVLGGEHPQTLTTLNNLAWYYVMGTIGKSNHGTDLLQKCYDIECRVLGKEHLQTLSTLGNLAEAYARCFQYKKALTLGEECYQCKCKIYGDEHPSTLITLDYLCSYYIADSQSAKALEMLEKCYNLKCKVLGKEHPVTVQTEKKLKDYKNSIIIKYTASYHSSPVVKIITWIVSIIIVLISLKFLIGAILGLME